MNCIQYRELLVDYIEGLLDESQKQGVSNHIATCSNCKAELQKLQELQDRLVRNSQAVAQSNLEQNVLAEILHRQRDRLKAIPTGGSARKIGRIIMKNRITKFAAGIVVIVIIAVAYNFFTGSGSVTGVAFGEVLQKIHNSSYTFYMTIIDKNEPNEPLEMKVHSSGILRWDDRLKMFGGLTIIADLNTGNRLLLYQTQKTAAYMKDIPGHDEIPDDIGPFDMFLNPIENLWNLRDGTEKTLGEKNIDGQTAVGFEVQREDKKEIGPINVWANKKTGNPIQVEITVYKPVATSESGKLIMNNFNLDAKLDEKLFSMKPPEGYTLLYQKTLDDIVKTTESSIEAQKILAALKLWGDGQQDKAIQAILGVDWAKPITFADNVYFFTFPEKEAVQLKSADQEKVSKEIGNTSKQVRGLCSKMLEAAQAAISAKEYQKAEQYLNATLELGKVINRDSELAYTTQMIGHSMIIKKSLTVLEQLYKDSGEQEKLKQVQEQIKEIDTEIENLKKQISNITGG
jgi:outer membrane lipoprotein-sorting protein